MEIISLQKIFAVSLAISGDVLSKYLDDEQIPFWVGKVTKDIEKQFHSVFGVPMPYPFVALVGNINSTFTVLELIKENMLANELIAKLGVGINAYKRHLQKEKEEENKRKIQRLLKEEQNLAFQRSLAEDAEKERRKKEEEEKKSINLVFLSEARNAVLQTWSMLPPEPDNKFIRVGIRLPNGSRVERKFAPQNTLQLVYDFAAGSIANDLTDETYLDDFSPTLDSEQTIIPWSIQKYELVQNYPKTTFGLKDADKSLAEFNLGGQTMLFLQRKPENS